MTVRYSTYNSSTAILTIEPGVELRFASGTGLYIGDYYYGYPRYGAVVAQEVTLTSNAASPTPGDWKGVYFRDASDDSVSHLEQCVIEYGGQTTGANLYLDNASPMMQYNTIRSSSGTGVVVTGSGSQGNIRRNTITGNVTGITVSASAAPSITDANEIAGNSGPGITLSDAAAAITNNTITGNSGDGIAGSYASASLAQIAGNTIADNGGAALHLAPNSVKNVGDNSGSGNGEDIIKIQGGSVTTDGVWKKLTSEDFPYIITGDVTVRYSTYNSSTATLTIEPGVELRFASGTGLYIGDYYYGYPRYGALIAQGVTLTSNAASPAPGDWKGVYFRDASDDSVSHLEQCVIEYGGQTTGANVYLANASPTMQYNTIRNSSSAGILVNGAGCNDAWIRYNDLSQNPYGVYTAGNAQPALNYNNFVGNTPYGVYNASSSVTVDATNNWWGDDDGPNLKGETTSNGDWVSDYVDYDPWQTEDISNSLPLTPNTPSPAAGAVNVDLDAGTVTLIWEGGDPDEWDRVEYDVYLGTAENALENVETTAPDVTQCVTAALAEGSTYFWQIVARDTAGAETKGPIWHFTTRGDPPDLLIASLTPDSGTTFEADQEVTLTATIQNAAGAGPVVDAFQVEFLLDDVSLSSLTVNPILYPNEAITVTHTWTASAGSHTISVVVDSAETVSEDNEANNSDSVTLEVLDVLPPELVSLSPSDGAFVPLLEEIVMTLADAHSDVADDAVLASIAVRDGSNQLVTGTVSESNDTFTFTPAASPFANGAYTLTFLAKDTSGNEQMHTTSFTVDADTPEPPAITGGIVTPGGRIDTGKENRSSSRTVTLTGAREANTSIRIWRGTELLQQIARGSGDWLQTLSLNQGLNALRVEARDAAGNLSDPVPVDIVVDSVAPAIASISIDEGRFFSADTLPAALMIQYQEDASAIAWDAGILSLRDSDLNDVCSGLWNTETAGVVACPLSGLADSVYSLYVQLADEFGNRSASVQRYFTIDTQLPQAPEVTTPANGTITQNPHVTISGAKEAYSAILLDGAADPVVGNTLSDAWTYPAVLTAGAQTLSFRARDRAGNVSSPAELTLTFDDTPPLPLDTLIVNGNRDGASALLDWNGYDATEHGDIAAYEIYVSPTPFTDIAGLTPDATVPAGTFTTTLDELTTDTTYWFAVAPVDAGGARSQSIQVVEALISDETPPADVTDLRVECAAAGLRFLWTPPENADHDFQAYRITFDGATSDEPDITTTLFERSGLAPAAPYALTIQTVDTSENVSPGVQLTGITWLQNPTNVRTIEEHSGYVTIAWNAIPSAQTPLLQHYAVYASETPFPSPIPDDIAPRLVTTAAAAGVAGLTNGATYYLAVTAVNTSGGEDRRIVDAPAADANITQATPQGDTQGPVIDAVTIDGVPLSDEQTIGTAVELAVSATDPSGVSRVKCAVDGQIVSTAYTGDPAYSCPWNAVTAANGAHTFELAVYDTLNNVSTAVYTLHVSLDPPPAPHITHPAHGMQTNQSRMQVSGTAPVLSTVSLALNGVDTDEWVSVDPAGAFTLPVTLAEGENTLAVKARYHDDPALTGAASEPVTVTLDPNLRQSPTGVEAVTRPDGQIKLTWRAPAETFIKGYNLYRATGSFDSAAGLTPLNSEGLLTGTSYIDWPDEEGPYYYRLTTVSDAEIESELSEEVMAASDRTPPAATIVYSPARETAGRVGPGKVDVVVNVSESLKAAPFLSINPDGGAPIPVRLIAGNAGSLPATYTGSFEITGSTISAEAFAVFSAYDLAGNKGTDVTSGSTIDIDTDGPAILRLDLQPGHPIRNDAADPVTVTLTVGLDEPVKTGTQPELSYTLSGPDRTVTTVTALTEVAPAACLPDSRCEQQAWQAALTLPTDAGVGMSGTLPSEDLLLTYRAVDALGNISTASGAVCDNADCVEEALPDTIQVYQNTLPALAPPTGLQAETQAGGRIALIWERVAEAEAYQLYCGTNCGYPDHLRISGHNRCNHRSTWQ